MTVRFFQRAGDFLACVQPFLLEHEAENNLLLGVAGRLRNKPEEGATYCAVEEDGSMVMAAVQAKTWNLVVSRGPDAAVQQMVQEILAKPQTAEVPGVTGPAETAGALAKAWSAKTGVAFSQHTWLRVYETRAVIAPKNVGGAMSPATREDLDLITGWMIEFSKLIGDQNQVRREEVEERLSAGHFFLWRDGGKVVSIAGWAGPTPNGVRVNSVYTPSECRNHGYATANVAALTQHLLAGGKKFVFLFTDLKNPTSNSIYQKIGYRSVCDFNDYRFG